jgi:hypothetical protein
MVDGGEFVEGRGPWLIKWMGGIEKKVKKILQQRADSGSAW